MAEPVPATPEPAAPVPAAPMPAAPVPAEPVSGPPVPDLSDLPPPEPPIPISTAPEPPIAIQDVAPRRDPNLFLAFLGREVKPAVAALTRNAFRVREERDAVTLFFDRSNANLIPMVKSPGNLKQVEEAAARFFGRHRELHFSVGSDPAVARRREEERQIEEAIRADPKVQFILERFGGSIVKCEPVEEVKDK